MNKEACVKGIDSEEYEFLNDVDRAKKTRERELYLEEKKEIEEVKISFIFTHRILTKLIIY